MKFPTFTEAQERASEVAAETGHWTAVIDRCADFGVTTFEVQPFAIAPDPSSFTRLRIVAWEVAPR